MAKNSLQELEISLEDYLNYIKGLEPRETNKRKGICTIICGIIRTLVSFYECVEESPGSMEKASKASDCVFWISKLINLDIAFCRLQIIPDEPILTIQTDSISKKDMICLCCSGNILSEINNWDCEYTEFIYLLVISHLQNILSLTKTSLLTLARINYSKILIDQKSKTT